MKVLIVADDDGVRRSLACLVRFHGWKAHTCDHRADFTAKIPSMGINALLIDQSMRPFSGLEVLKSIRAAGLDVPAVLMTPDADILDRNILARLDVFRIIGKPPNMKELKAALTGALKTSLTRTASRGKADAQGFAVPGE
jgi:DNA-binding NtrC family response regulator